MGNDHQDTRAVHDKPFNDIPRPTIPKSTSGFSLKAAGRTFSFGRPKGTTPPPSRTLDEASSPTQTPPHLDSALNRPRAVTSSSYASTATPPKLEERDLGLSLGGDFSDMFSGFGKRQAKGMDIDTARDMSKSPVSQPEANLVNSTDQCRTTLQVAQLFRQGPSTHVLTNHLHCNMIGPPMWKLLHIYGRVETRQID